MTATAPAGTARDDTARDDTAPDASGERYIATMRDRIDEIDAALVSLWHERADLSRRIGAARVASGGTRLVLDREREILDRFHGAIGADGVQLGLLLLRAGRGRL
jgi:chorismate mutase